MIELVRRIAETDPARVALVTHDAEMTYAELLASAESVAAELVPAGVTRLATVDHEATTLLPVLLAGSAIGVEVCQYPPSSPEEAAELAARFGHDVILGPDQSSPSWSSTARNEPGQSRPPGSGEVVSTDRSSLAARPPASPSWSSTARNEPDQSRPPEHGEVVSTDRSSLDARPPGPRSSLAARPPGPRPHLVLTTGTSGTPKGVRHDWDRLVRSTRRIKDAKGERWLLAYGLHQFAGLQILLHVFAAGATLVAPAPRRPIEGLAAMRQLGVTHASATPTYWRFLLAEMRSDGGPVPALQQITLGGEAIPGPLLARLEEAFPTASISQVYAASEFGSTGSQRDGRAGLSADVLERGDDADVQLKIVDGELWVRSRIGMLGYYGEEPVDPDAWRATGDTVSVEGDRILFAGRVSEIINVGGVKVHPLPVEERIAAVPGVDVARVFGRPNAMTGAIVAVEVVAAPGTGPKQIKDAVRKACEDLPAAARPRSIKFVDAVTTAGDKIIRRAT